MADDKPAKKKSPLYDAPKGEPKHGARPEKKPEKEAAAEPKAEKKAEDSGKEAEGAKVADEAKPKGTADRHAEERAAVHKSHEGQRKDMHGNHREEFRKMASRHEKELSDLNKRHLTELAADVAPAPNAVPGNEPEAPQAQAVAAAEPAAA